MKHSQLQKRLKELKVTKNRVAKYSTWLAENRPQMFIEGNK